VSSVRISHKSLECGIYYIRRLYPTRCHCVGYDALENGGFGDCARAQSASTDSGLDRCAKCSRARSHNRDRGTRARFELTDPFRCLDERADLRCRVVGRHVLCLVAEEQLAILEADTGNPQPMTVCMLHVVHANRPKPCGTRAPEFALVARCRTSPGGFPARVVNTGNRSAFAGKDEFAMPAPAARDNGSSYPV